MGSTHGDRQTPERPSVFRKLVERLKMSIGDTIARQQLRDQLAPVMEYSDQGGVVEGLGIHRSQVPAFIDGNPAANRLLPRMARHMGINLYRDVDTGGRNDMIVACSLCGAQKPCGKWMDEGHGTERPGFCRNGAELDALKRQANR